MRSFGYTGYTAKGWEWGLTPQLRPLSFPNDHEIDVSFVTRHAITELQQRNQKQLELPFSLNTISLGASDGRPLSKFALPIPNPRSGIFPTADGNFVVVNPDEMILYSPKFEQITELTLHDISPTARSWSVGPSPSGRSIFVTYDPDGSAVYQFERIDPDTFQRASLWRERYGSIALSDDRVAIYNDEWLPNLHVLRNRLIIRALDGSSRVLCDSEIDCGLPAILNQNTLVLLLGHNELKVVTTDGKGLFNEKFPYDTQWVMMPFGSSANGQRFAVPVYRPKGGWPGLDISPNFILDSVVVYDIGIRGPAFTLNEKKSKTTYSTLSGIALSPNGCELAVLANGVLDVYSLPSCDASESGQ